MVTGKRISRLRRLWRRACHEIPGLRRIRDKKTCRTVREYATLVVGLLALATIILAVLRGLEIVSCSWWWVFSPVLLPWAVIGSGALIFAAVAFILAILLVLKP